MDPIYAERWNEPPDILTVADAILLAEFKVTFIQASLGAGSLPPRALKVHRTHQALREFIIGRPPSPGSTLVVDIQPRRRKSRMTNSITNDSGILVEPLQRQSMVGNAPLPVEKPHSFETGYSVYRDIQRCIIMSTFP